MINKLMRSVVQLTLIVMSRFVPKKNNLWLFYPRHAKSHLVGNMRAVHEYVIANEPDVIAVHLRSCNENIRFVKYGLVAAAYRSFRLSRLMWFVLRAELIFLDSDNGLLVGNFRIIQLWHGTGFKNIGALAFTTPDWIKEFKKRRFMLVVASSRSDQQRKEKAFLTKNVYITGTPRNDVLFRKVREPIGIPGYVLKAGQKAYLYAPTFRERVSQCVLSESFWLHINNVMAGLHSVLFIKRHPSDKNLSVPIGLSNVVDITDKSVDIQQVLMASDVLITDYSGIVSDYVLLNKPVVFFWYDFNYYVSNCREFYYDIETLLPGPFAYNERDLVTLLSDMSWFNADSYRVKYNSFVTRFHRHRDGGASKRVVDKVKELCK